MHKQKQNSEGYHQIGIKTNKVEKIDSYNQTKLLTKLVKSLNRSGVSTQQEIAIIQPSYYKKMSEIIASNLILPKIN